MRKLIIGILAHVDAGKTTLSESMLYAAGSIRKMGRVDNGDAFLDTYELEKARGITIFSKQAVFNINNINITLLDTPGHIDFSAEMERTLQVLDYGILVISGTDGIQGHTQTLWKMLKKYEIPVFLFINKMDQSGTDRDMILKEVRKKLADTCIDFGERNLNLLYENIAMCDEALLDSFLDSNIIQTEDIKKHIYERKLFPCFFGSALRSEGIEEFICGIEKYTCQKSYPKEFGAKIFKISRDNQGNRLTHIKITGGSLKVRSTLTNYNNRDQEGNFHKNGVWEEKVNQIRVYSGEKFTIINEAEAGMICAITGLSRTYSGEGLGIESQSSSPFIEPVLTYQVKLPQGCSAGVFLPKLRELEEEEPGLNIIWNESLKEIQAQVMGEVQIEVLKSIIFDRFGIDVEFGTGNILYKETIKNVVEGVGHFEPLRHYSEVHLLMEPGDRGSGMQFAINCSEDLLDRNWQRLVLAHLKEKEHKGVLTGASITDMKITLVSGRAHQKHTEGGDFRQATYRAVRNGLKKAESILLEPYYEFRLEIPEKMVGKAMADIEKMQGTFETPYLESEVSVLIGIAPVIKMRDYQKEVISYTKGYGRLFLDIKGYEPCHNAEEIINEIGYDSERDMDNPTGSVFCEHGTGFVVSWDKVEDYMHLERYLETCNKEIVYDDEKFSELSSEKDWIDIEEIDKILEKTFYANKKDKHIRHKGMAVRKIKELMPSIRKSSHKIEKKEEYLLVDGYNIIFGWRELKELAEVTVDGARNRLMDILCNYQGIKQCNIILVFDAYKIKGHITEIIDYNNIHVVYTKEAETADQYIEKFAHDNGRKHDVTVATSDGMEQIIIRGQGCKLLTAKELEEEIDYMNNKIRENYMENTKKNYLLESLSDEVAKQLENIND